jgi:uncharacterized protein (TIGR02145 family)
MYNKKVRWIYLIVAMGLALVFADSCKKDDEATTYGTVTDIDGNIYHTVTIGTQVWMVENLKTTKYRNGDSIPNVMDSLEWHDLAMGAYCNYNNDAIYSNTYGRLYNWYAVTDSRNIAPIGWHVPTKAEWATLTTYLGGESAAGGKLKETGTLHWISPNNGADNSSGFTALPGGYRIGGITDIETFGVIGEYGNWWSSSEGSSPEDGSYLCISNQFIYANNYANYKKSGFSIRCIKD